VQRKQAAKLAARAGYPHHRWTFKHRPSWFLWWRAEGMAILSRHPTTSLETTELSDGESTSSHRRRIAQVARIAVGDERPPLAFVNTHLTTATGGTRRRQAERLAALLPSDGPGVLVGDLNTTDDPAVFEPLAAAGFRPAGEPTDLTFPAGAVDRRIDFVVLPVPVQATRLDVPIDGPDWAKLSDHLPVVADLTW
jgi:endonuclease/exonuclease/phosphatase family metal-dependent hydrolase